METTKKVRQGRKLIDKQVKGFDLKSQGITLKRGDRIKYYAVKGNIESDRREERVE